MRADLFSWCLFQQENPAFLEEVGSSSNCCLMCLCQDFGSQPQHRNYYSSQKCTQLTAGCGIDMHTVPDKCIFAWVQIDLKCPSNIFLINIFLQEMANFNPNSFWNNVLVQNETVEKYSNVHSLVKPIESIFAKTKVLSPCHMMHPILD